MKPSRAIKLINDQLEQIPNLKDLHHEDSRNEEWRLVTKEILKNYFGADSDQVKNFSSAGTVSVFYTDTTDSEWQTWYIKELEEKAAVLRAAIKGIELLATPEEIEETESVSLLGGFDEADIEKLTDDEKRVFNEAMSALKVRAYTPCALACRAVFESIVKRTISTHSLKPQGSGLGKQVEALKNAGLVGKKYQEQLLGITKHFGDESQHQIKAKFDSKKCSLIINSILILLEEVF